MSSFGRDEDSGQERRQPARSDEEQQHQTTQQQSSSQEQQPSQRPRQPQIPGLPQQDQASLGIGAALQQLGAHREHPQVPPTHLDLVHQQRQQEQQLASLQQLRNTPGFGQFQSPINPYSQFASNFLYPGLNPLLNPAAPTPAGATGANPGNPAFEYQRQLQQQYGQLNQQQLSQVLARFQESSPVNQQVALALLQQEVANRQQHQQQQQQQEQQRMALRYQQFMQAYGHPEQTMAQRFGLSPEEMASLSGALSSFAEQDRQRKDGAKQGASGAAPARRSDSRTVEGAGQVPSEANRHSRSISAAALESQKQAPKDGEPTRRRGQSRSIKNSGSQSSNYRGVTFHRRTGRWEAHLWDGGKQMYLGGFDSEAKAATAYDFMALKCRGEDACLNFGLEEYKEDLAWIRKVSREELIQSLRRHSKGFTRGSSKYRGVSLNPNGKWEARCSEGKQKYSYLGLFDTEEAAAAAYDRVCVRRNGKSAVTNFDIANYPKELSDHYAHKSLLEASRADTGRALGLQPSEAVVTTGSPTPRTNQDDSPSAVTQRDPVEESKPPEGDQGSKVDKDEAIKSRIDNIKREDSLREPLENDQRSRDAEAEPRQTSGEANDREDAKRKVPDEESPDSKDKDQKSGKRQKEG